MHQLHCIIFDLDGTLTDPGEGIINSLIYALKHFGIKGDPQVLRKFIGPPLIDSFMKYYNFNEKQAKEAIRFYRRRFHDKGVFENYVYPGIPELLQTLTAQGKKLAIATTKPTIYAVQVLEHFGIDSYFEQELVVGSYLDGSRTNKAELISTVIKRLGGDNKSKVMVGDRKYDILGAKANDIDVIGVTYGYGEKKEIELAEPTWIVDSVSSLKKLLVKKTKIGQ
ncbi:MAG: HAD family hydrolase [Firmicutes bacterium]|nr:HAD family hydrolase [Bacillota bacterium]